MTPRMYNSAVCMTAESDFKKLIKMTVGINNIANSDSSGLCHVHRGVKMIELFDETSQQNQNLFSKVF